MSDGRSSRHEVDSQSQWELTKKRFARHRLAVISLYALGLLYGLAIFAEFFAPYTNTWRNLEYSFCPPQPPRLSWQHGLHLYRVERYVDPVTYKSTYMEDPKKIVPLGFFVRGEPYRFWGLFAWDRHFFGVDLERWRNRYQTASKSGPPTFYLLGADQFGQDLFSRIVYGARISLSVGIVSIVITFLLGLLIGGISGYLGGAMDNLIQRLMEILNAFPQLPLWLALAAIMPDDWSPLKVYFGITVLLALLGWTGLARVVRGKLLSLREEDYAVAARLLGASHGRIIFIHLLPGFSSHIIVTLTLSVPGMILGETALSFLGLGLRPPIVSWGVLLRDCMNMQTVANYPWLLLPVLFIVITVLCCNFLGDGMRDAADPYASR